MSSTPSAARIAANKANALKSTGPRTPEGKARVSENALKHGLRSERNPLDLVTDTALPFEREEFQATLAAFMDEFAPTSPFETRLVERLAQIDLRLNRAVRMETTHLDMQMGLLTRSMAGALPPDEQTQHAWLTTLAFLKNPSATTLIAQYESRLARDFARTLTQLRQAQKLRVQEMDQKLRAAESALNSRNQTQPENCQSAASNHGVQSQDTQNLLPNATDLAEQTQPPPKPSQESVEQTHQSVESTINLGIEPPTPDQRSSAFIGGQ